MRITNIILTKTYGGAEQVFLDYAKIFQELGHDISFVVKNDVSFADDAKKISHNLAQIEIKFGYFDIFAINKIAKFLRKSNSDVVVAHGGRAIFLAKKAIAKINKKITLIAVNHSMNVKRSIGSDVVLNVNKEIFYKTVDLGQSFDRSFVIYNGIDFPENIDLSKINIDFSHKKTINLGTMDRLDKSKNIADAIRSIDRLNKRFPGKFILKIAGSGEEEQNLKDLVFELNLQGQVQFLSWVDSSSRFFQEIDIFILPSLNETFGLVILEAIRCYKPIIASKSDGPKEIIRHKKDGLLVDIDQQMPNRIAASVLAIISDKDLTNNMIKNSYQRAVKHFSKKILIQRLSAILNIIDTSRGDKFD